MRQALAIFIGAILLVTIVVAGFAYIQSNQEEVTLSADLQYRTHLLTEGLKESVEPSYREHSTSSLQTLVNGFAGKEHLSGLALFGSGGSIDASSNGIPNSALHNDALVRAAMDSDTPSGMFVRDGSDYSYQFVDPIHADKSVVGALMVVEDAGYIDDSIRKIWRDNLWHLLVQMIIFTAAIVILIRWVIYRPIFNLVESIRNARTGRARTGSVKGNFFFSPLAKEISKMHESLFQARMAASEEARMRQEKLDTPWTEERLKEFIKAFLKKRPIFVVSNREPYVHTKNGNALSVAVPASGMVTALEPVMAACGGMWIAHGSGSGDMETADEAGKLRVPPDDPKYMLKRVWLTDDEVKGHYTGFSNEALWPLCHMAHTRPIFRQSDWEAYVQVNQKFADAVLLETKNVRRPVILIQDFHFALLPALIKARRPDAQIGLFWHIPWPHADAFSICPYRKEILQGMLGADIIGFHTQQYCNNFMETVGKEIESVVDLEQFAITSMGHRTYIKPFPISIAFTDTKSDALSAKSEPTRLPELGITTEFVGLGVDRLDYTKGILERFLGVEYFLDAYPDFRGRFTFLQIAPPSRETVEKYREYNDAVTREAARINDKFATPQWRPIVLEKQHYTHEALAPLFRRANLCLVTSLHDGMNLVAKEYVAAHDDERGVLILSRFTGASRDLKGAILINPYSAEETAEAIESALTMPPSEQRRRMESMRSEIKEFNVYRWSAEFIKAVVRLENT